MRSDLVAFAIRPTNHAAPRINLINRSLVEIIPTVVPDPPGQSAIPHGNGNGGSWVGGQSKHT